jgi:hypothetical protein
MTGICDSLSSRHVKPRACLFVCLCFPCLLPCSLSNEGRCKSRSVLRMYFFCLQEWEMGSKDSGGTFIFHPYRSGGSIRYLQC